jgi:hypothetical protein
MDTYIVSRKKEYRDTANVLTAVTKANVGDITVKKTSDKGDAVCILATCEAVELLKKKLGQQFYVERDVIYGTNPPGPRIAPTLD